MVTEDPYIVTNIFGKLIKQPKINAMLVQIDETGIYDIPDEDVAFIKAIKCTYLYDKNERVNLCELTPSYYLRGLYTEVYFTEAGDQLSEREKQEYYDWYENSGVDENNYFHCFVIDSMPSNTKVRVGHTGVSYKDSSYDEQMEGLREHYCCNHAI